LRPLILAPRMAELAWLRDRPEAAPGLAAELVDLFDEVRLARREAWILEGSDDESLMQLAGPGAEDVLQTDLARIRDAWRLYREVLPRDQVDVRVEALTTAAVNWPGTLPSVVVAAHFARLDEVTLALLRGLSVQGVLAHWLTISADDPRSRLLLATYRDASGWSHPLAGVHRLAELNTGQCPVATWFAGGRLNERAEELGDARDQLAHNGPLRLMPCRDPEHESRVVAVAVCQALPASPPSCATPVWMSTTRAGDSSPDYRRGACFATCCERRWPAGPSVRYSSCSLILTCALARPTRARTTRCECSYWRRPCAGAARRGGG